MINSRREDSNEYRHDDSFQTQKTNEQHFKWKVILSAICLVIGALFCFQYVKDKILASNDDFRLKTK